MIHHYLKVAFRNLVKYKTQSFVSIIGLAVGFTCFVLSALWIRYEMTYDTFYEGAERTYILYHKDILNDSGYSTSSSYPLSTSLKRDFPEVESACAITLWDAEVEVSEEGQPPAQGYQLGADSCFMNMFHISLLSGTMDFMYSDDKLGLTKDMAMRLFGSTDILGRKVKIGDQTQTICAILDGVDIHSNLSFGFWAEGDYFNRWRGDWSNRAFKTIIRLHKGVNPKTFERKLHEYAEKQATEKSFEKYQLMPITDYYYSPLNEDRTIQFHYLVLFAVAGGLVIICSLFNYFSLFFTRIHMRVRELELRTVCGSSRMGLFTLLSIEYLLLLLLAGLLGMTFIELSLPAFRDMSHIDGNIYKEPFFYLGGVAIVSLLSFLPFIIRKNYRLGQVGNRSLFRKISIVFQLIISILFIFCLSIIMKQLCLLTQADLGWERKNIAVFQYIDPKDAFDAIAAKVEQMPCTQELLKGHWGLLPQGMKVSWGLTDWDGKQGDIDNVSLECITEGEELVNFYNLKLLKGEMLKKDDSDKIVINETAAKALGMNDPIGKKIYRGKDRYERTIIGVIKDFHITPPTVPVKPMALIGKYSEFSSGGGQIIVKYHNGRWQELKHKVDAMFAKEHPGVKYALVNVEEVYDDYLKSEYTLLNLLGFVAVVCVLISIFGIFSLVMFTCAQRRKEIAIRKVNGATVSNILTLFLKEYFILLIVASVTAFPIGYVLMKHWLESYIEQTEISIWTYIVIFITVGIIILLCIIWRVWKAAWQNPAEVIKSE